MRCPSASIVSVAGMSLILPARFLHPLRSCERSGMAEQMRPGGRRPAVVRLGVPGLIVAVLTLMAFWRVGPVPNEFGAAGTTGGTGGALEPLTHLADALAANAVGRRASLENVPVRQLTSR